MRKGIYYNRIGNRRRKLSQQLHKFEEAGHIWKCAIRLYRSSLNDVLIMDEEIVSSSEEIDTKKVKYTEE